MKKLKRLFVTLLTVCMFAVVFITNSVMSQASGATNIASATIVTYGQKYYESWSGYNQDEYFYKFYVPSNGVVNINATKPVDSSGDYRKLEFRVYNTAGEVICSCRTNDNTSIKTNYNINFGLEQGTYYLTVQPYSSISTTQETYFSLSFKKTSNAEKEYNGSKMDATPINLNTTYTGHAGQRAAGSTDEDFYRINLTAGTKYRINFKNLEYISTVRIYEPDGYYTSLYSYLEDNIDIALSQNYVYYTPSETGTYYFYVSDSGTQVEYSFKIYRIYEEKWYKDTKGWWYQLSDGSYVKNAWKKIDGFWYYFNSAGYRQTGWQKISNKWYFFTSNGTMSTGWKLVSGKWYYLNSSGVMLTGWQRIGGKWYYLNSSGAMATNWLKLGNNWYYLGSDGAMATGWKYISGNWYYFNASGVMAKNTYIGKYYVNSNGVMVN